MCTIIGGAIRLFDSAEAFTAFVYDHVAAKAAKEAADKLAAEVNRKRARLHGPDPAGGGDVAAGAGAGGGGGAAGAARAGDPGGAAGGALAMQE
jgi:hypothetical protein